MNSKSKESLLASNTNQEHHYCLKWQNFQANISSQLELLRDDECFTDVTIACEKRKFYAHKVILSACSPFFKDLFKSNPCHHPIVCLLDVPMDHIEALLEFVYAGEVRVAQSSLSEFLRTAERLQVRGLTESLNDAQMVENTLTLSPRSPIKSQCKSPLPESTPPKRPCHRVNQHDNQDRSAHFNSVNVTSPKLELIGGYMTDDEQLPSHNGRLMGSFYPQRRDSDSPKLDGHLNGIDVMSPLCSKEESSQHPSNLHRDDQSSKRHSLDPRPCSECGRIYSNLSNLRQHMKLVHYPTFVQCPVCQRTFKTDLYLKRHMIFHDRNVLPT